MITINSVQIFSNFLQTIFFDRTNDFRFKNQTSNYLNFQKYQFIDSTIFNMSGKKKKKKRKTRMFRDRHGCRFESLKKTSQPMTG